MNRARTGQFIIVADDFGISQGVNQAIVQLVKKGRISAVSCMSLAKRWPEGARLLKPHASQISVGLHLTLSSLPSLPSFKSFFLKGVLHLLFLEKDRLKRLIEEQFKNFIQLWGAPPAFIDGHQHVHLLPTVRQLVLELREQYAPQAWVRNLFDPTGMQNRKASLLLFLGWPLKRLLEQHKIPHNLRIRGPYRYGGNTSFEALITKWCNERSSTPTLIYCHPGFVDEELKAVDPLWEPREQEFHFLNGETFKKWLSNKVTLTSHP